jgi:hypothetical protein
MTLVYKNLKAIKNNYLIFEILTLFLTCFKFLQLNFKFKIISNNSNNSNNKNNKIKCKNKIKYNNKFKYNYNKNYNKFSLIKSTNNNNKLMI